MAIIENIKIDVGMVNYNCDISILNSSVKSSILKKTKYLNKLIICSNDNGSNKENLDFLSELEKLEK